MSEKRHRLYVKEVPEVINGLFLRLEELAEEKKDNEKAETVYRTLYRLMYSMRSGRPKYPKFSWEELETFLKRHKSDT